MMKLIVVKEDGSIVVSENILDYNFIDVDLVQKIAREDFETELTNEELDDLKEDLESWEELPDTYQLQGLVEDIIKDRE
jgi:hypothetical protein